MNLEELLGWDSKQFNSLSESQLIELCKPFWNITRPELIKTQEPKKQEIPARRELTLEQKEKAMKIKMAKELMAKLLK